MKSVWFLALAVAAGVSAAVPARAAELRVHGSSSMEAAVFRAHKGELERATGLTLNVAANGSARGLEDLLRGDADIAMISAPLQSEKDKVQATGKETLQEYRVGLSTLAFIVRKDAPINGLNTTQAKSILSGGINNWSQLGGPDAPIVVIVEDAGGGTRITVENTLLNGPVRAQITSVPDAAEVVKAVAATPGAFGVTTTPLADDSVKLLGIDQAIQLPLAYVTRGPANNDARRLIEATLKLGIK
ncbi:MAG: substrate-binding domain-containing protein [Alphaproteobacteria bacterium]|nr:substrate-binding domain-containing protein [Alphaproteobacteria bacterium]